MALAEIRALAAALCPPLDLELTERLLAEFTSLERRYVLRDWEPSQLDAAQFAEILARILYHQDSGNLNRRRELDECLKFIDNDKVSHRVQPRSDLKHVAQVLRLIYKLRSQRGVVHISPTYSANQSDARLMMESVRWCMSETLRIFLSCATEEEVARRIRELLEFDVPCIGDFQSTLLVQRTDLDPEEEILLLLHYAGDTGFTRRELGQYVRRASSTTGDALRRLLAPTRREVVELAENRYRLTDLGHKKVRETLSDKLVIQ